jgi:hypothetical protein
MLFMEFAQIELRRGEPEQQRESMNGFANRYGCLGIDEYEYSLASTRIPGGSRARGERFEDWRTEVSTMHNAVRLWRLLDEHDVYGLARCVQWIEEPLLDLYGDGKLFKANILAGWYYCSEVDGTFMPIRDIARGCAPKANGRMAGAWSILTNAVNNYLGVNPTLEVLMVQSSADRKPGIVLQAAGLLTVMWLQFARAIEGNKKPRACKDCGKWFEVSAEDDGRTARRLFCTEACKTRDYRRRKDRAQQLKAEGMSVKAIAKDIDTDLDTIKKWITTKQKG